MKISLNLLRTLIDFDWSDDEFVERLTLSGSEAEAVEEKGREISGIITAKVLSSKKVEGADKLSVCEIFDGKETIQVICGAPNVAKDQNIIFAPVGSKIPGLKLKKAKIRGVESFGMILSEKELQISDSGDGIMVLDDNIEPGTPLDKILNYKDTIVEFEITPNRPDCLSHLGIAREIQALGGGKMRMPDIGLTEISELASDAVKISIDDPDGCSRYTGRVIRGTKIGQSPLWLKMMVYNLGMRPINNVVDITNYVMLELGQPLHAFDFDLFAKPEILVRRAEKGEKFITLDDVKRNLTADHLMITDSVNSVAIGGIMGGMKSEVSESTSNILLESAFFNPVTIRRGSKNLGLMTESSKRFERGADINMAPMANDRACKLISEIAGGEILTGMVDTHPKPFVPVTIKLNPKRANDLLGTDLSTDKMVSILKGLNIEANADKKITAIQPSFRPDLVRDVDLIEEIARIYGFDNIETSFIPKGSLGTVHTKFQTISGRVRAYLSGKGATEIFPVTLAEKRICEKFGLLDKSVNLINPLSEDLAVVRPNLIVTGLPVIKHNHNYQQKDLFLFEIGNCYLPAVNSELPTQKNNLFIALSGNENPIYWGSKPRSTDMYSLKGILEDLAGYLKAGDVTFSPSTHFAFDKTRSFDVYFGKSLVGQAGKLSSEAAGIAEIKSDVFIAELDFDVIIELIPDELSFNELDRFPSADRDIAVLVDESVKADEIKQEIIANGKGLVREVWIFDLYKGKNIPKDKKSLAFGIKYRHSNRTLKDNEVDEAHNKIAESLKNKFKAELRS